MIDIRHLSFGYSRKTMLFESLDLRLKAGSIYGLLGKNGAGKSTLLKLMSGLLFPQDGDIRVMGFTPQDRLPQFLANVFFLPEELFVPNLTVEAYKNLYGPFYPAFDQEKFTAYLNEFEVDPTANMAKLSYGQKKKALLSFGLATRARLIIFDEPTNGLDIPSKTQFRRLLAGSIGDDQTYLVSTHQVRDMANLIDPIIILEDGKIIFNHLVDDIMKRLLFEIRYDKSPVEGAIYYETIPGGNMVVSANPTGEPSEIDLEVLFNAVIHHTADIQAQFRKEVAV